MITCPKCHYTRHPSDTAPEYECPKCGVVYAKATAGGSRVRAGRSRHVNPRLAAFIVFGLGCFIYAATQIDGVRPTQRSASTPQEAAFNSSYDGSVRQVESHLKRTLKDPESFQAIQWFPVQKDLDGYTVRVRYRAKNSFGGYVVEEKVFLLDRRGNVIP